MKIGVDIDGVLLNLIEKVCEIFNELYHTDYTENNIRRWEFFKDWNVSEEVIYNVFYIAYEKSTTLSLIDDKAPQILKELNKKYRVDLVTARNFKYESQLIERLNSLEIKKGVHYENLIHVEPKPYDVKIKLDYNILIDDNPNLVDSIEGYSNKRILLYDQPWNQRITEKKNVSRVYNWKQIRNLFALINISI